MSKQEREVIVLGGGCFWCVEAVFEIMPGVVSVRSGYAGGRTVNPTYDQVISGKTGHAEVVQVEYDPEQMPLEKLLEVFFSAHDPTTLNRQGNDVGERYRSVVLYVMEAQRQVVDQFIKGLEESGEYNDPIVTEVKKLDRFYEAEEEQQDYWRKNPEQAYCQLVIAPKVEKIKKKLRQG